MGSVLLIVMGASYFAHYLGLSYSIGAFIAGIMIAETHFKYKIESSFIPFRDLLLGIFFITV
jgi:CPA2 family monovalent cation:H+ antiporter-2